MKAFKEYILEHIEDALIDGEPITEAEETIKDENSFRDYAENKFKEVFGDKLDTDKMKKIIDGIIEDSKDEIDNGDWGAVVGKLNKSFGS